MSMLTYILIGTFDAFAVFALTLKIYRLPLKSSLGTIFMTCFISSVISYLVRVKLDLPWLDLILLTILIIIYFRFIMKIRIFYAGLITGAGLSAYISLQFVVMIGFLISGAGESLMYQSQGIEIHLFQIVSITAAYLIASWLKIRRYGFSFIPIPPHDFRIKRDYSKDCGLNISVATALVVVSLSLLALFNVNAIFVGPSILISFGLSYYFSNRRDLTID